MTSSANDGCPQSDLDNEQGCDKIEEQIQKSENSSPPLPKNEDGCQENISDANVNNENILQAGDVPADGTADGSNGGKNNLPPEPEDFDIDLKDPEVSAAAAKIQSSFRRSQRSRNQFSSKQKTTTDGSDHGCVEESKELLYNIHSS